MMERLQVLTGREYTKDGETKVAWSRIGVAFPAKNGDGWDVTLDALPISGKMILRPPKPKDETGGKSDAPADLDSEIPF